MAGREAAKGLTHVRADGSAHMVDVSAKAITARAATAAGRVLLSPSAVAALRGGEVPKGDALAVARIAGIQAVKRTPELIPLAHPIAVHGVEVDLAMADDGVDIQGPIPCCTGRDDGTGRSAGTDGVRTGRCGPCSRFSRVAIGTTRPFR